MGNIDILVGHCYEETSTDQAASYQWTVPWGQVSPQANIQDNAPPVYTSISKKNLQNEWSWLFVI